ncbi:hypothetical protein JCM16303_003730 [Sporobolomyces ruberrimus]
MTSLAFAAPLPPPTLPEPSSRLPQAPADFLSTPQGELSFFRSLVSHRLVGPDKHFHLLGVVRDISNHAGKYVGFDQVWEKYREVYNEEVLETTWADQVRSALSRYPQFAANTRSISSFWNRTMQEITVIERDGIERRDEGFNDIDPPILEKDDLEALEFASRPLSRIFPQVEFSLDPEEFLSVTAFERGQRNLGDPPDSPAEAPLREIFYEPEEENVEANKPDASTEDKKRSPRKRIATPKAAANAAAAVASPRKKKAKQVAEEASGSELSDLTDDEEDDEDQDDEEEGGSPEETAGEDAESYLEDGTAASHHEGEEEEEEEEEAPEPATSRKRKAAPGRKVSATSKRTRNARSASVATADSRTAADRKKDQATATPTTRGRGRVAGGSGKKAVRPNKKK